MAVGGGGGGVGLKKYIIIVFIIECVKCVKKIVHKNNNLWTIFFSFFKDFY